MGPASMGPLMVRITPALMARLPPFMILKDTLAGMVVLLVTGTAPAPAGITRVVADEPIVVRASERVVQPVSPRVLKGLVPPRRKGYKIPGRWRGVTRRNLPVWPLYEPGTSVRPVKDAGSRRRKGYKTPGRLQWSSPDRLARLAGVGARSIVRPVKAPLKGL